jgi:hypothetical protein
VYGNSAVLYVVYRHDVFITRANNFPGNARFLFRETERIDKVIADPTIGLILILMSEAKVNTVCAMNGIIIGTLGFKETQMHVNATEDHHRFGDGSRIEDSRDIHTTADDSCIPVTNGERNLGIFDRFYPDKIQTVGRLCDDALRLQYLREQRWIVALERGGTLARASFPHIAKHAET